MIIKLSYSAFSIFSNVREVNAVYPIHNGSTGARGTDHPPFSNFLFTNLFSIKFLYFFIISSLFPYFNLLVSIFINLMLTSNCMCIDTNNIISKYICKQKDRKGGMVRATSACEWKLSQTTNDQY